jgi:D-lyxose ketol-isomerase
MKRSEINRYIEQAKEFAARHNFCLPPFAFWTAEQWAQKGHEADEIRTRRLGWDLTDFNLGTFLQKGLTLFTLRNGKIGDPANKKAYAEKLLIVEEGQVTPFHFHWMKTEDIINRGVGVLVCELYNSDKEEKFTNTPVRVSCDGVEREVKAGGSIELAAGESITLTPYLYHQFYARKGAGKALIGEVSSVNDDATDNRFYDPLPRFPTVQEDVPPTALLCNQYPAAKG